MGGRNVEGRKAHSSKKYLMSWGMKESRGEENRGKIFPYGQPKPSSPIWREGLMNICQICRFIFYICILHVKTWIKKRNFVFLKFFVSQFFFEYIFSLISFIPFFILLLMKEGKLKSIQFIWGREFEGKRKWKEKKNTCGPTKWKKSREKANVRFF